jgi:hypothetical protein
MWEFLHSMLTMEPVTASNFFLCFQVRPHFHNQTELRID